MPIRELSAKEQYDFFRRSVPASIRGISASGNLARKEAKVIAIVGARDCTREAEDFAFELARACVRAGAIVASGGAMGIDSAAHRGALAAKGRTWAVLGKGANSPFPEDRADLFAQIAGSEDSSLIWPFPAEEPFQRGNYRKRNGYLVRASDEVVIVQAALDSGSLNTANHVRRAGRLPWVVPVSPWHPPEESEAYAGNRAQLRQGGVRVLTTVEEFLSDVYGPEHRADFLAQSSEADDAEALEERSEEEKALLLAATNRPKHLDDLCEISGLSPATAATALLTLSLEHVLVEGPPGYYRRGSSR